jgi:hypothetical protein
MKKSNQNSSKKKSNMSYGLAFASRDYVLKYHKIVNEVIIKIFDMDPRDVILTDESDTFHFINDELLIIKLKELYNIEIGIQDCMNLRMKALIDIILAKPKTKTKK